MKDARQEIINYLKENKKLIETKEATIGIDAFIDKIVRVVHSKSEDNEYVFLAILLNLESISFQRAE